MLWYSLEAPHRGASNEYPQHMVSWRNKKKNLPDNFPYLDLWKIQISPHISAFSLGTYWVTKYAKFFHADNEDSKKTVLMHRPSGHTTLK